MSHDPSQGPWSDDTLCSLNGFQPSVTQKDILSTTTTDKVLTVLKTKIEKEQNTGDTACSTPGDNINEAKG
jgi:hypothetical protein